MFLQLKDYLGRRGREYFLINTDSIEFIDSNGKGGCIIRLKSGERIEPDDTFDDVYSALREADQVVQPGR